MPDRENENQENWNLLKDLDFLKLFTRKLTHNAESDGTD